MSTTTSSEQTEAMGAAVAADLGDGDCLALVGDLGAGKTHFVKGIVKGLGSEEPVSSPTFTIVHEYVEGAVPVFHFDFYRLESADEAIEAGWPEYLDRPGVVVVEWADRFPDLLPPDARWWRFERRGPGDREIRELPGPPPAQA